MSRLSSLPAFSIFRSMPIVIEKSCTYRWWYLGNESKRSIDPLGQSALSAPAPVDPGTFIQSIFARAAVGVGLISANGHIMHSNPAFQALLGYSADELPTLCFTEFTYPRDASVGWNAFQEVVAGARDHWRQEKRYVRKDGRVIWGRVTVSMIPESTMPGPYGLVMIEDITARKQADEALRQSEATYRALFERSLDAVLMTLTDGTILDANHAACVMLGMTREEICTAGRSGLLQCGPEVDHGVRERHQTGSATAEMTFVRKNGTSFLAEVESAVLPGEAKVSRAFVIFRDISGRRKTEEILRESEARLVRAQAIGHIGSWELDLRTNTMWSSAEAHRIYGFSGSSSSQSFDEVQRIPVVEDRPRLDAALRALVEGSGPYDLEFQIRRVNDASLRSVHSVADLVCDQMGAPQKVVGVIQDVTERKQAETLLRLSQFSIDHGADYTLWVDKDGRLLNVSESLCERLGYSRDELLGMAIFDVDEALASQSWPDRWLEIKQNGPLTFERRYRTRTGEIFPVEVRAVIFEYEGREYDCGIARDISERKKAEEVLKLTQFSVDHAVDSVFWTDPAGRLIYVSDSTSAQLGYSRDELLDMSLFDLDPTLSAEQWAGNWKRLTEKGTLAIETVHRKKDGESLPVEVNLNHLEYDGRAYNCVFARDITDRKRLEEGQAESQRALATLMANLPGMAYRCCIDSDWTMLFVSEGCEQLTGYKPSELVGNVRVSYADLIHPDDRELVWGVIQAGVRAREPFRALYRIVTADAETKWVWEQGQSVLGGDGSPLYLEGFITDISEKVRAEQSLREAEEKLRQSQKMEAIGQLAGGIAHDFNNLLTAILGYSDMVLSDKEAQGLLLQDYVKEIKHAAERAAALTRQILAFSRRQALQPVLVSPDAILAEMEPLLRRTLGEDIDLVTSLHPDVGLTRVDVHQFEQVLMNLAINARDAMPVGGQLTLETVNAELDEQYCRVHPDATPGSYVLFSVSDTGVGMDTETQSHIFEPFFTTKAPGAGTGLGLSTVYGIVRQSGGSINVYSEPGRGTTFKVYLPRLAEPESTIAPLIRPVSSKGGSETILVVEDEDSIRSLVARILEGLGYAVFTAANGDEALELLATIDEPVDLLLTDVILPGGMRGNELAQILASSRPEIPVVYMSGYSRNAIVHSGCLDEGINYLEKPFTLDGLATKVREVLDAFARP
jgi:two-component system, cell cycle sensor histidine kinase and response regulator CckA